MRKLFAAFLVSVILLGGDLIWRAWAQTTNTFCSSSLACTLSAKWIFGQGSSGGNPTAGINIPPATLPTGALAAGDS